MGRTAKAKTPDTTLVPEEEVKTLNQEAEPEAPVQEEEKPAKEKTEEDKAEKHIITLMKLYPQYESFYVTPEGFVHPDGVPEYVRKGAKLYKNKFYNK